MKKNTGTTRKLASALLAAVMLFSAVGCGNAAPQTAEASGGDVQPAAAAEQEADTAAKADERPTIRWLTTGDSAAKAIEEGDRIVEAINERLGIDLQVEVVPEANTEKVNVAMASGDFPDIVTGSYGTSATQSWIQNGMVIPLNDYLDDNAALKEWLEQDYPWSAIDGAYYGAPFITQYSVANTLIVFRQDWLDNLGLKYPQTLEEMKEVLVRFTTDDPDGDGKDNTYGFTAEGPSSTTGGTPFDWVFHAYGLEHGDYALNEAGEIIPTFDDPSFVPAMSYIKELWDLGVIDSELMLNDTSKKEEKFYQGKAGAMPAALFRHVSRHESSLQELYPEASICYDLAPAGEDGSRGLSRQGKDGFMTCVTAACEHPDKAAAFINFMLSEEGIELVRLGIEGVHYTKDGDTITYNEEEREKDAFAPNGWAHALAWGSFFWPLESGYIPVTDPNRERALETVELATKCQVPNLVKQKTPAEISDKSALNDIFIQYFSDMLQGKIGIEEGQKKLDAEWRANGGDAVLEEVTAAYRAQEAQ